jgi:hypothetical protein
MKPSQTQDHQMTNPLKNLNPILLCFTALALSAFAAQAQTLQVDIQSNAGAITQAGWNAWEISETASTTTQSTSFAYAPTTGGNLGVSLTPATNAIARKYGLENISDPGKLANPNVWADQYFWNNNTGGSMTLTLTNLTAGIYQFTSFHYADNLAIDPFYADEGTASVFVNTGSGFTDTGEDVTFTAGQQTEWISRNLRAAQVMADGTLILNFTVANDGDPISIRYQDITGGDSFGINGFQLTTQTAAEAAALKVQTTNDLTGTTLQPGWNRLDGPRNDPSISAVVNGITITIDAESGAAIGRSAGGDGGGYLNVDHTDGDLDALLSGGRLTNQAQDLRLTLSGLAEGTYRIVTYHHSMYQDLSDGAFEFDVLLTDANGTGVLAHDDVPNSHGAVVDSATLAEVTTSFTVSGGNDVVLAFSPDAGFDFMNGGDQMVLNGFKLYTETPNPLVLKIFQSGGNLDFEWNSQAGMQYDLVSSTGLDTAVSTWPIYNDGVMLYEAVPATGASTTLTGVLKSGPVRFFAMREYPAPPLFNAVNVVGNAP